MSAVMEEDGSEAGVEAIWNGSIHLSPDGTVAAVDPGDTVSDTLDILGKAMRWATHAFEAMDLLENLASELGARGC